jgi:clumping factor A
MKRWGSSLGLALWCLVAAARPAAAAPALRVQMDLQGDFVLFGNTLAHECDPGAPAVPAPVVGTVGACPNSNNYAPDVYWRADAPAAGQASANSTLGPDDARSTALLALPADARVVYARIYWGSYSNAAGGPDDAIRVQRPSSGLDTMVTADDEVRVNNANTGRFWYQATADVTALVQAQGVGAYRIADVEGLSIVGLGDVNPVAAWYVVVLYERSGLPWRNVAIFDGLDLVDQTANSVSAALSGFLVPQTGYDAKLGVVAYEGEAQLTGDSLRFNDSPLSDAVNPANNFFNASRSALGSALSVVGDLPQLTGGPRSMTNVDLDVVDVTALVAPGNSTATIEARTNQDTFLLASFITSISTLEPDFVGSLKAVTDLNGGAVRPGDALEYRIEIENSGSDASIATVVSDALPAGVSYVAGSLELVSGDGAGAKTDAAGDDQGEYDPAARKVIVRIGTGASAAAGGKLAVGARALIRFEVTVDVGATGKISNQALVTAQGELGAPSESTATDGNGVDPGQPPTDVTIDGCERDADCAEPAPFCDVASRPHGCVTCLTSAQCTTAAAPDCNFVTHVCECTGGGSCKDGDGDGISDPGEGALGSDPDDADSDDDGVPDGSELAPSSDSDGDGAINALDPDSDDDGLFDGTELGLGCDGDGVNAARRRCRADGDDGATTTNPLERDSDGGGVSDGSEDFDLDGVVDSGESDPTNGHGADDADVTDADGDGLSDGLEAQLHSKPDDADSDDDGALDGEEANPSDDADRDRLVGVLDVDSDDDGLFDGTEQGKPCDRLGTGAGHCRADSDGGATVTSPVLPDSDGGGARDGSEDHNLNGVLDADESDPTATHGSDDAAVVDGDGDGLSDGLEATLGTKPDDADSDDDGALDGEEANPSDNHDGEGAINPLDPDSDGDGLFDGTELGQSCTRTGTDARKRACVADADRGTTRTSPVNADTDFGTVADGDEDANRNGRIDAGEHDPNEPSDDLMGAGCSRDDDCGRARSGVVCESDQCVIGCRGEDGNGCPAGLRCTSDSDERGTCVMGPDGGVDSGVERDAGEERDAAASAGRGGAGGRTDRNPDGSLGGGGCDCRTARSGSGDVLALLLAALWLAGRRRNGAHRG